jgi:hypothetical protein
VNDRTKKHLSLFWTGRRLSAARWTALALLIGIGGCRDEVSVAKVTQLLVVVHSDLGSELAEIELQTGSPDGHVLGDSIRYPLAEATSLPRSFAIVPRPGATYNELLLIVRAFDGDGGLLVETTTLTSFLPGRTASIDVWLWGACRTSSCAERMTCASEHGQAGRCAPLPVIEPHEVAPGDEVKPSTSSDSVRAGEEENEESVTPDAAALEADASEPAPLDAASGSAATRGTVSASDAQLDGGTDASPETGTMAADSSAQDDASGDASTQVAEAGDAAQTADVALPAAPRCDDELKNGVETDVDCGGPTSCARCGAAHACVQGEDCLSGVCTQNSCTTPTYAWKTSSFGSCSASACGVGTQSRTVRCEREDGALVSESLCPAPRPAESRACQNTTACSWYTGAYGTCSVRCGGGTSARAVYCRDSAGAQVPDAWCTLAKPQSSMSCNAQACVVYVAGEPSAAMGPCWSGGVCAGGYPAYPACPAGYEATRSEQACGNPNHCDASWALCTFQQVHQYGCSDPAYVMGVSVRECTFR